MILDSLPSPFKEKLGSVEILIQDQPTRAQLQEAGMGPNEGLYGLFEGRSELETGFGDEDPLPRRILIFRGPLTEDFPSPKKREEELRKTLLHELGHFFGLAEETIEKLGYG